MDDEGDCEVDRPDSASKLRDWQLMHAHQERDRQWIAGVMRDLHRRTPRRLRRGNLPPPLTIAPDGATPFSPAAAPSPRSPSPLNPANNVRLQASASPEISHAGPLSEHTGPLSSESWRGAGDRSQQSPPFLARTAEGLSWLGGPDVGATTIGSSHSGATTIGAGGGSLSYLGSGGSGGSPVDVRSAGRGALGLTSPPSGRFHPEGDEEEKGERQGEAYSPPQPRAFWREEWHGGRSGGSGSRGNRSHGGGDGDDDGNNSRSRRREEAAGLFGVDCETRDWNDHRQMGASERFTTATATTTAAPLRRLDRKSAEKGVGTARCRARNASRDLLGGQGRRENGASGGSSEWAKSGKGRGKYVDFSSGLGDGFGTNGFDKVTSNGNGDSGGSGGSDGRSGGSSSGSNSSGSGVLSAAGFALLASVAVAAFAVGALLAPPPLRQRSAFPSATPLEYALQRPSPGYEPTMVERQENRGKSQRAKLGKMQTAAASAPQASTAAAEERGGESNARDAATAAAPSGAEAIASPSDSRTGSSMTGCPKPAATDVGGRQAATVRLSPISSVRDVATMTAAVMAGSAVGASLPGADADNSRRGKTHPGALEPTARVSNLTWNRDVGDPKWRRWRQRARPPATQKLVVGVDPDAFAKTLGSAENSLLFLSDEDGRQAQRDAWRAAASESAATTACKAMASSRVTSATEGGGWEDGPCDTGAAASKNGGGRRGRAGGGKVMPHMFPFFPAQGGTPTLFSQYSLAAAAAASQPNRGGHTEYSSGAPSVQQTERGAPTPLASKSGSGEQLESTSPPAAQRETSDNRRPPDAVYGQGRGPALPPPCSGLVLSGNDVQASWAGLYTLALVREARAAPGTDPSATPLIETPVYYRESALPPPVDVEEECEGGGGQGTSTPTCSVTLGGTDSVTYSRKDAAVPDRTDLVSTDWTEAVASSRTGAVIPDRIDSVTPDRTDSVSAGRTDSDSVTPEWVDSVPPGRTDSVSARGEASGGAFSSLEMPLVRTPDDAAPLPPPTSGDQQQQLGGPGAATDGIVLCLYWADASGGRWVLDDDLSLSNGVLGVTKDAAPASPYLAFPNHRHHHRNHNQQQQHHDHHTHNQHEQHNHNHRDSGGDGSGDDDGISQKPLADGAGDGKGRRGAALSPPLSLPSSFLPSPWLLDSPRLQGWAEAEDVVVVCETN